MDTTIIVVDTKTHKTETKEGSYYMPEMAQKDALEFAKLRFPDKKNYHYRVWMLGDKRYAFILAQ